MSDTLTQQVKDKARAVRADLVGIASIDRFESVPADRNPVSIFPECKSVIVVGRRVLRGAVRGVEEGTSFNSTYAMFGFRWLEDNFLAQTTYDLTCFIESLGFEAVPLFGYNPEGMPHGRPVAPGKPAPNVLVDLEFAAQAAGLGEVGLGDFFITPRFGTRQRFAVILTDAALTPDDVRGKSICSDCGACAAACPFKAIDTAALKEVGVPGHTMKVAAVDFSVCGSCPNGAARGPGRGSRPDRIAAACGRACMIRLEQAGKLENAFANPFRKRKAWALDTFFRPVDVPQGNPADIGCGKNFDEIGQEKAR